MRVNVTGPSLDPSIVAVLVAQNQGTRVGECCWTPCTMDYCDSLVHVHDARDRQV